MTDEEIYKLAKSLPCIPWGIGSRWPDALAFARALLAERAGVVPEGWQLFAAKGLPELMAALERADRKGYLPDAVSDEWAAFQSTPFAAPEAPKS